MTKSNIAHPTFISCCLFLSFTFIFLQQMAAQPSGGPYGPVFQTYELPKTANTIYYVSPNGSNTQTGSTIDQPTTLEKAIEKAVTGDVIILRGGTYRTGNLVLNQGITLQPFGAERPVLKGTYVAQNWKDLKNGLWVTKWDHFFPSKPDTWWNRSKYARICPMHLFNNDMVFVNGQFLQSVGQEKDVNENTYYIDYESGLVYIGVNPQDKLVEITAFNSALHRVTGECNGKTSDKKGFTLKGIDLTQYAYCAVEVDGKEPEGIMNESEFGKDVVGTTIEDCSITFCSRVAAYLRGDKLTMRNCKISDTSTEGIYIIASNDVLLEKNIFARNNIENIVGYFPAAVKIFNQTHRVTCYDNLITDLPESNGVWYDVGNVDGKFINNWVENVGNGSIQFNKYQPWPSQNGFFFEISKNVVCAGNVFVNCDHGIFVLNSTGAEIYNNTLVNSAVTIGRNDRSPANDGTFGWHSGTGPDVDKRTNHVFANNLLFGNENLKYPLLIVWQPDTLYQKNYKPQLEKIDNNVFARTSLCHITPTIFWTRATNKESSGEFLQIDNLRNLYGEFGENNHLYTDITIFKSVELKNFEPIKSFDGNKYSGIIPADIMKTMNIQKKNIKYVGAYPPSN
ncbi:conserved exported hypothetical protein [uncultured Paludibacter sp.]|uniref:Right handed beta helix domain-containing protein n=1 Tax=uncultured Paludibacter sp. TaxID=497635 RepID=A0A653AC66_9BACT|nr:conserved exported hypothetical protein [uncultured Paludibacter sp.]